MAAFFLGIRRMSLFWFILFFTATHTDWYRYFVDGQNSNFKFLAFYVFRNGHVRSLRAIFYLSSHRMLNKSLQLLLHYQYFSRNKSFLVYGRFPRLSIEKNGDMKTVLMEWRERTISKASKCLRRHTKMYTLQIK